MVVFQLTGVDVPITIQGNALSYDREAVARLGPAVQVAFVSIVDAIETDQPERRHYEPDTSLAWYRYIETNNDVTLLKHDPPTYVEGRVY